MEQLLTEQYLISDAARQVEVESHVLRYWEEELKLPIQRNKQGHRFYTKEDIERFRRIKQWKEQGLQLKAIRNALQNPQNKAIWNGTELEKENVQDAVRETAEEMKQVVRRVSRSDMKGRGRKAKKNRQKIMEKQFLKKTEAERTEAEKTERMEVDTVKTAEVIAEEEKREKAARFQFLMSQMMKEAVRSNNEELLSNVQEMVVKEMDFQFRQQEERNQEREERRIAREEEHFKKIDMLLRNRSDQAAEKKKKRLLFGLNG
ncbi:MAG: MerR family transcriptional regulator [Clostridiales bacterium]|nr:MerR family transcriptional regulator [Clostridiales bacterium]